MQKTQKFRKYNMWMTSWLGDPTLHARFLKIWISAKSIFTRGSILAVDCQIDTACYIITSVFALRATHKWRKSKATVSQLNCATEMDEISKHD